MAKWPADVRDVIANFKDSARSSFADSDTTIAGAPSSLHDGCVSGDADARERQTPGWCRELLVMVVEDHDDLRHLLVHGLESFGAFVMSANNGAQALSFMKVVRPDVLVSDLLMPGQDGFELLQQVRSSPVLMDVPAIAITGHGDLRGRADRSGFQRVMEKPIDTDELCRAIGALAGRDDAVQ